LVRAAGWHGVAMVEFKLDEVTGECRLMEVNGRFWGSLPLAVAAGADFPYYLVELLTRNRRPAPEERPARTGVLSLKLSDDLYWYIQVMRPNQDEPLIAWPSKVGALKDLLAAFLPRHNFDVQTIFDARPGLVDVYRTGEWFVDQLALNTRRAILAGAQARAQKSRLVHRQLRRAREILFVCYGNINRSLVAERHLSSILSPSALAQVRIRSAGFHPVAGRPADPSMVEEARRHGLPLERASSRTLDTQMIARADLILAMELKHILRLQDEYPDARRKIFLLGTVAPLGEAPLEIADPYGGDEAAFARSFREVTACTRAIARTLERTQVDDGESGWQHAGLRHP
jgi:protein-tyrosine-phosphatase